MWLRWLRICLQYRRPWFDSCVKICGEGIGYPLQYSWASLVAQLVKNLPAMWETWVQSLGWEDPWRRERFPIPVFGPGEFHGLHSPQGRQESNTTERLLLAHSFICLFDSGWAGSLGCAWTFSAAASRVCSPAARPGHLATAASPVEDHGLPQLHCMGPAAVVLRSSHHTAV